MRSEWRVMSKLFDEADREQRGRPLPRMIRLVRDQRADRLDAAEELREVRQVRLEILADALEPVFADVPKDDAQFDFVISSGFQPRLWIDAAAHVVMARDSRTYRFVYDGRLGRSILAESDKTGPVAEEITRYIAERIVERERLMAGRIEPAVPEWQAATEPPLIEHRPKPARPWGEYVSGILLVLLGMIAGAGILIAMLSDIWPELLG